MTPTTPSWNPHDVRYADQEANMLDHHGHLVKNDHREKEVDNSASIFAHKVNSVSLLLSPAIKTWSLATTLNALRDYHVCTMALGERRSLISPEELACTWQIDLNMAQNTVQATTQRLVPSMVALTLNQRYSTNNCMLQYKMLQCPMFTDTYFASKKARTLCPRLQVLTTVCHRLWFCGA